MIERLHGDVTGPQHATRLSDALLERLATMEAQIAALLAGAGTGTDTSTWENNTWDTLTW